MGSTVLHGQPSGPKHEGHGVRHRGACTFKPPRSSSHKSEFIPYLPETLIHEKIKELAAQLDKDYQGKKPLFISILNGSFMFSADLFKELSIEAEICFIKLASYKGTKSTGHVITAIGLDTEINKGTKKKSTK